MSKAEKFIEERTYNCSNQIINGEKFIKEYTKNCSNVSLHIGEYYEWLTPDQARRAVEIAREEVIEQTAEWLAKHAIKYYFNSKGFLGTDELVEDYKLIMTIIQKDS